MKGRTLTGMLLRFSGQRTVLYVALPVLHATVDHMKSGTEFPGLTRKEVADQFEAYAKSFLRSSFHSTYIQRRLGEDSFLIEERACYQFRSDLLEGETVASLSNLIEVLEASILSAYEERVRMIDALNSARSLPSDQLFERSDLIRTYLSELQGNLGERFEVFSYAVLREYFRAFGFELRRFSTTHANDGGMDFVAGSAIYQVSADESMSKLSRDQQKMPGVERVIVRPKITQEIHGSATSDTLSAIDLNDLLEHFLGWLVERDKRFGGVVFVQRVIETAIRELQRENQAERFDD